ncbi:MAG: transglutaminase-like domain-containing protein, partial [Planctomycetota bacterium]
MGTGRTFLIVLAVAALSSALAVVGAAAEEKILHDSWYGYYMQGSKVGWVHEEVVERERVEGKVFVTRTTMELNIARMGREIRISQSSEVVEDEEGCLLQFTSKSKKSALATETWGVVKDGKLVLNVKVGAQKQPERIVDLGPTCLPAHAMQRLMKRKGQEPGTKYKAEIFTTETPDKAVELDVNVIGPEVVDIMGAKKHLVRLDTTMKVLGMKMITKKWFDQEWRSWKTNTMGLAESYRMPKDVAMMPGKVREVFPQSIVPSDRLISNARQSRRQVFRLTLKNDESFDAFPTGLRQTILREEGKAIVVEIKAVDLNKGALLPLAEKSMEPFLASSAFLRVDDPLIEKMARETVGDETDSLAAARKLEKKVYEAIKKKNFGVGFATASEVAKNLEGDCSEHAVLLAALCRVVGIPSRVVGGLIYADLLAAPTSEGKGGFGFHLWTEVFVGQWVALDATLGHGFADATHITMARSALEG